MICPLVKVLSRLFFFFIIWKPRLPFAIPLLCSIKSAKKCAKIRRNKRPKLLNSICLNFGCYYLFAPVQIRPDKIFFTGNDTFADILWRGIQVGSYLFLRF